MEYISIIELTRRFKEFVGDIDEDDKWVNTKWIGGALKRLNLNISKRRLAKGREVIINQVKAKQKLKIFKKSDDDEKNQ